MALMQATGQTERFRLDVSCFVLPDNSQLETRNPKPNPPGVLFESKLRQDIVGHLLLHGSAL